MEDTKKFIKECEENFIHKKSADFGVRYEGKWVGSVGFRTIKIDHKWVEMGY